MTVQPNSKHPVEQIPGEDNLFRRVPPNRAFPNGKPRPGAFSDKNGGMSSSWDKYAKADACRGNPPTCGVAKLNVMSVRDLGLGVAHTPRDADQAHSDVSGEKDDEIRLALANLAEVAFAPDFPKK